MSIDDQATLPPQSREQDLLDGIGDGDLGDEAFSRFIEHLDHMLANLAGRG